MRKALSIIIIGALICSALSGCTSSNLEEVPKEGTELVADTKTEETETLENETQYSVEETSESESESAEIVLPKGTYVRAVKDGFIKEIQEDDGLSYYKVSWGNSKVTGTETDLNFEFLSIPNIGSWKYEDEESGVWRYISDDIWFTTVVWGGGMIPSNESTLITIDKTNIEDIKSILNGMIVYEETLSTRRTDKYAAATVKIDRVEAGLSGYMTIIDDLEKEMRWLVQFIMLTGKADYDILKMSAESVVIGSDFSKESLEKQLEFSETPVVYPKPEEVTQGQLENVVVDDINDTEENSESTNE